MLPTWVFLNLNADFLQNQSTLMYKSEHMAVQIRKSKILI